MRTSVYKRAASLLICVAFLLSVTFVKPQKAEAVALTSTAVVASVAAIMTACGVSYWANTQQDAISYLGGQIDAYLDTLSNTELTYEDWLGISENTSLFTVIGNGVLSFGRSVANKILDFVRWFNAEEGVTSGGQAVGEMGGVVTPTVTNKYATVTNFAYSVGNNGFTINSGSWIGFNSSSRYTGLMFSLSDLGLSTGDSITVSWSPAHPCTSSYSYKDYPFTSYTSSEWFINLGFAYTASDDLGSVDWGYPTNINNTDRFRTYGYAYSTKTLTVTRSDYKYLYVTFGQYYDRNCNPSRLTFDNAFSVTFNKSTRLPDVSKVTPSASVSVPNVVAVGQTLDVTTNANITQGASVEDASSAIIGTVVTAGGLSSTNNVAGEAVPSESIWLWDAITSLPDTIANAIKAVLLEVFIPDQAFIDDFFTNLDSIFNNRFSLLSYPFALLGTFITKVASMSSSEPIISWPNIYEHFSGRLLIAAGSYNLNSILANQAIANMYAIYMIVIKAIISFQFVAFLYAWFCDVFHMRNSDFDNPYDLASGGDIDDS